MHPGSKLSSFRVAYKKKHLEPNPEYLIVNKLTNKTKTNNTNKLND